MKQGSSKHHPTVAIASSKDGGLGDLSAPLDATLNYQQVDAVTRRALDLDSSPQALKHIILPTDWVVIKPNIVTSRSNKNSQYWYEDIPHPGQVTDLRVIKSLIGYLIENCSPKRITIAEGGAEWEKTGEPESEDGWTVHWPEFDNLSYADIVAEYDRDYAGIIDIVDLNDDDMRFEPVPDPNNSGVGALQRTGVEHRPAEQFGREAYVPDTGTLREGYHIPETILTCNKLISVPAMKTHTCGTTLAMKNYIGILPNHPSGAVRKGSIHSGDMQKGFIDLFSYHPADYSVLEGFWSTEGNGPQWGDNIKHNVVVASADPVAADAIGSAVMGFNLLDLDYLYYAASKGFGTFDVNDMELVGQPVKEVTRKFKRAAGRKGIGFSSRGNRTWLVKAAKDKEPRIFESAERYIDLAEPFGGNGVCSATAWVDVKSEYAQKGKLWASADGEMQVEINGKSVLRKETENGHQLGEYQVDVELKEGMNRLSVQLKCSEKGFGFTAILCDELGDGLYDVSYSVDTKEVKT